MKEFARLLDRLSFEPARNNKLRLLANYFREAKDPDRGYALAVMTGDLSFANAKPSIIRALVGERVDNVLFDLSYDYVGDLSETAALIWPRAAKRQGETTDNDLSLENVVSALRNSSKSELPGQIAGWLDELDETGRWTLLKIITGSLRIGVSARLAKSAIAAMAGVETNEIEEMWSGLVLPYEDLFAWAEGRGARPELRSPALFRAPMLAHAIEETDRARLSLSDFAIEWKWDGVRVQAASERDADGRLVRRLYSRSGDNVGRSFPELIDAIGEPAFGESVIDGELLVVDESRVQPFSSLQQRLNRKSPSAKIISEYPGHIRAYDILILDREDLRPLPFFERRRRLEEFVHRLSGTRIDLSPLLSLADWAELDMARSQPSSASAEEPEAIEGLMLKRNDSPYVPGRPKGLWWKWKRDPFNVDAVLMYAQRGHGKRSSFYSDFTFGVWRSIGGVDELVPVGKAYFGFTDQELRDLDRWVRNHTQNRYGPVREVEANVDQGLVLEISFEGLNVSSRHKSGLAMRFPRISRIRWDKKPGEADRIELLQALTGRRAGSAQ